MRSRPVRIRLLDREETVKSAIAVLAVVTCAAGLLSAESVDEYVERARCLRDSVGVDLAAAVMEQAVQEHPLSAEAHAYLGAYVGMQAGRAQDFMEAGRLSSLSFQHLDRAVALDSVNVTARFYRGLMGVNVPEFLGRLDRGIADLEFVVAMHEESDGAVPDETAVSAYNLLGAGYLKKEDPGRAKAAFEKVIGLAPGTEPAKRAEQSIGRLAVVMEEQLPAVQELPDDPAELVELGKASLDAGEYADAAEALRKATELDFSNREAFEFLARAVQELASVGYDEQIALNTDLRTNLAFELVRALDRAVELAPEDMELRLWRGISGIQMPFFVGKLDAAIADLELVTGSDAGKESKAEALYYLGLGYQRKAMSYWIQVVSRHGETEVADAVLAALSPDVKRFDPAKYEKPVLAIDFILGFKDELPPQTAIWIQDEDGEFVKTVYVSGFSGYAKGAQVDLPRWAKSSGFEGCEAVTGASIDLGHHIYVWDLKDSKGGRVEPGNYHVNVEVCWWPSMRYQLASATIELGVREAKVIGDGGEFVPFIEVSFYPE